ncbi:hypothetical protein [Litchfieldia alkalitelluris]|uniref:hypothetical protein n=1 Tax=Litchfieldia alkalitelluris TaxID=304268 RepID=UPI0009987D18|nr:hypothetical protein [Litchfieldia alkalitelluris]
MKKTIILFTLSFFLLGVSISPLFMMTREYWTESRISDRYEFHHAFRDEHGFETTLDTHKLTMNGLTFEIVEEQTGKKAPLTSWDDDEVVPPGDIVKIHLLLNDEEISTPDEI